MPIHARAVEGHLATHAPQLAAQAAARLSKVHLECGNVDVSRAWLTRARDLLGSDPLPATAAYVLWMESRFAALEGRPEEARKLAGCAVELAEASPSTSMQALAIAYEGLYDIALGHVSAGRTRQDQAAAMALSSEVDPVSGGAIYCSILWTCRAFADWSRAAQWSAGFELWCRSAFAETTGTNRLHRAEILGTLGKFSEALAGVDDAIRKLSEDGPWAVGDAFRVRGDIEVMMGNLAGARHDYEQAVAFGWDGEPGLARLLAEAGDVRSAIATLDRLIDSRSWYDLQRRGWLLANKAQIAAVAGLDTEAQAALDELERWGEQAPIPAIRAMAVEAQAELAGARRDMLNALQLLHLARQLWTSIRHEYHAARIRLRLAEVLEAVGETAGAQVERAAARVAAERISARTLLASTEMRPAA
jgi:hypothetical protein